MKNPRDRRSVLDYNNESDLLSELVKPALQQQQHHSLEWLLEQFDDKTTRRPSTKDEVARLRALCEFQLLGSNQKKYYALDDIVSKLAVQCNVKAACVCLVDLECVWVTSTNTTNTDDLNLSIMSRTDSFCAHTILQKKHDDIFVVTDARNDFRFQNNPYVTGETGIRFYAGAAIVTPEGHAIGSLCLFDSQPRTDGLLDEEKAILRNTAGKIMQHLLERRDHLQMVKKRAVMQQSSSGSPKIPLKKSRSAEKLSPCPSLTCSDSDRNESPIPSSPNEIIMRPYSIDKNRLPDPHTTLVSPDEYLAQLVATMGGVQVQCRKAEDLQDFFMHITEDQMAAYNMDVVGMTRENQVARLRDLLHNKGRAAVDCYNRFGESLLNMACRRGFQDIVQFFLSDEVNLNVRIKDDGGRTPIHDACWHPEPQLQICSWLLERDPALFLVKDNRGFTAFQYARPNHWDIWRQFLYENSESLIGLLQPDILKKFSS